MTILVLDHKVIAARKPSGDKTNSRQPFNDELEIVFQDERKTEQSLSDDMSTCIGDPYQPVEDDDSGYDLMDTSWFATVPNPHTGNGSGEAVVIYYLLKRDKISGLDVRLLPLGDLELLVEWGEDWVTLSYW